MYFGDFTITKREIIFSIVIVAVMVTLGLMIHGSIDNALMLEHQEYNTALRIENDTDMFAYGMSTNIGNSYVYGELKAIDTVTFPELDGQYSYVKKIKERYTRHTRTVTDYDEDGNPCGSHEEEYWTWDEVDRWSQTCKKITFLGIEFDSNKITLPSSGYICTIRESSKIRYLYYGSPVSGVGTIYTNLSNNTINNTKMYYNTTIEQAHEYMTSKGELVIFWVFWIPLTSGAVFAFVYIDNHWLEDRRKNQYEMDNYWGLPRSVFSVQTSRKRSGNRRNYSRRRWS